MNDKAILRRVEKRNELDPDYVFFCPGCKCGHAVWTTHKNNIGANWKFNGNMERPTFSPSILVESHEWQPPVTPQNLDQWKKKPWPQKKVDTRCHSHVEDGLIKFLPDCTHILRGQTVPLEPF